MIECEEESPTHLRLLKGNPGKRPLPRNEPKPEGDLFEAPAWLNDDQKAGWVYAVAYMPAGALKRIDRGMLVVWVVAESRHHAATVAANDSSLLVTIGDGHGHKAIVQNPMLRIERQSALIMIKAASELGFSPAARPRISLIPDQMPDDDFDDIA